MWNRYGYSSGYGYGWTPPKVHVTPVPAELLHDTPDQADATAFATTVEKSWSRHAKAGVAAATREAAGWAASPPSDDPRPSKLHGPG